MINSPRSKNIPTSLQETNGTIRGTNSKESDLELQQDALVSMNFWGFCPHIFHRQNPIQNALELYLLRFFENFGHLENSECYLPSAIDDLIQKKHLTCQSLKTDATWLGLPTLMINRKSKKL